MGSSEVPPQALALALDPPRAFGAPVIEGLLRSVPEDFIVDEELGFAPDGDGSHWLMQVRKRAANTEYVARQLAGHAGVRAYEVGFAGLKDRHALTSQWFTVPRGKSAPDDWLNLQHAQFSVLEVHAHRRKLRRGALAGNRFELCIRAIRGDREAALARAALIARRGVPNYFGAQRFGRDGGNLRAAQRWASGGGAPRSRSECGFALSAARSAIFNAVLAERVRRGIWDRLVPGDLANLDGSRSVFSVAQVDEVLRQRIIDFDIHPTAVLWGAGESPAGADVAAMEGAAVAPYGAFTDLLERQGLAAERRSARLSVRDLSVAVEGEDLRIRFRLPAGGFATTVMRELANTAGGAEGEGHEHD